MLDKNDVQVIKELLSDFEGRIDDKISATRNEIIAYVENTTKQQFGVLADGQKTINRKLDALSLGKEEVYTHEDRITELEIVTKGHREEIDELKRA